MVIEEMGLEGVDPQGDLPIGVGLGLGFGIEGGWQAMNSRGGSSI